MSMCLNNLKDHEGSINTMYRDSKGNITVGIGHYLGSAEMAQALPLIEQKLCMCMVMILKVRSPYLSLI
jgi:GH24 family phage-related lysozyme (muramidase)